jgi:hypothetical protein
MAPNGKRQRKMGQAIRLNVAPSNGPGAISNVVSPAAMILQHGRPIEAEPKNGVQPFFLLREAVARAGLLANREKPAAILS